MVGKLYIVPTPLGNLKDITLRALDVLKSVDAILCEDTRVSRKLLTAYEIQKPLVSFHEHNEAQKIKSILERLNRGESLALISDAGTPLISDPGYPLVKKLIAEKVEIEVLPGPCALISALVLSGLAPDRHFFLGFPPNRSSPRRRLLAELTDHPTTLIFYESPHRVKKFLRDAHDILGDRAVALVREMTKRFEEVFRGSLSQACEEKAMRSWKGEFVVVLEGAKQKR
jgi:16S rRNA (cytidine1402-2'-O)-methyltransferase